MSTIKVVLFALSIIVVTAFGVYLTIVLVVSIYRTECVIYKTIVEIGGCNAHQCGVRYDDNTVGRVHTPVVGGQVCSLKRKLPFEWDFELSGLGQ